MMQKIFNFLNSIFITRCRVVGTFLPRTTFCSPPPTNFFSFDTFHNALQKLSSGISGISGGCMASYLQFLVTVRDQSFNDL